MELVIEGGFIAMLTQRFFGKELVLEGKSQQNFSRRFPKKVITGRGGQVIPLVTEVAAQVELFCPSCFHKYLKAFIRPNDLHLLIEHHPLDRHTEDVRCLLPFLFASIRHVPDGDSKFAGVVRSAPV